MSYTVFYNLPLVPCGVFFGTLMLLLVVPVFAVAALAAVLLIALAILITVAGAILASPLLIARHISGRRSIAEDEVALPAPLRGPAHPEETGLHGVGQPV